MIVTVREFGTTDTRPGLLTGAGETLDFGIIYHVRDPLTREPLGFTYKWFVSRFLCGQAADVLLCRWNGANE